MLAFISKAQTVPFEQPRSKPFLNDLHFGNLIGGTIAHEAPIVTCMILEKEDQLKTIQVFTNKNSGLVAGIRFGVVSKSKQNRIVDFGDFSGNKQKIIFLKNNQKLIGISGSYGWFIDGLVFHFSDGTTSPRYGGKGGDLTFQQIFNRNKNSTFKGNWCGIYGSFTDQLESIGLCFWAVE